MSEQIEAIDQNTITLITNVDALLKNVSVTSDVVASVSILNRSVGLLGGIMTNMSNIMGALTASLAASSIISKTYLPSVVTALKQNDGAINNLAQNLIAMGNIGPTTGAGGGAAQAASPISIFKDAFGTFNTIKSIGAGGWKAAKGTLGAMKGTFASMGPQMAMLALVIEPVMALLNGILEPFSILTDIFGLYGQIIGQALLPAIIQLVPVMLQFIPTIMAFGEIITALLPLFMIGMIPALELLGVVMNILTPAFSILAQVIEEALAPITILQDAFTSLTTSWNTQITAFLQPMYDAVDWMGGASGTIEEFFGGISDFFTGKGKYGEWWKV